MVPQRSLLALKIHKFKKLLVAWYGLNPDCQSNCLPRAKCYVIYQGHSPEQGSWNFHVPSPRGGPDHTTTQAGNPIASALLAALQQWSWVRPKNLGYVGEWEKTLAINLCKLHENWPTTFLFSTLRQSEKIWWHYTIRGGAGWGCDIILKENSTWLLELLT